MAVRARREFRRLGEDIRCAAILRHARAAVAKGGYDSLSMPEVARRAGVSKALVFHYFSSRLELYVAVLQAIADDLVAAVVPPELPTPLERVRAGLDAYLEHVEHHRGAYLALVRSPVSLSPEVAAVIDRTRERILAQLGRAPGVAAIASAPMFALAMRGWAAQAEAMTATWCENEPITRRELRELLFELLIASIRAVATRLHRP